MLQSHKRWIAISLLLLSAAAALAWGKLPWTERQSPEVVVIVKSTDLEFWQVLIDGVHEAAKEFRANVKVWGAKTETDVDGQIALVEKAIAEHPDAIVLAANDFDLLAKVAEKAASSGIKLLIVDSGVRSDSPLSVIATDNIRAGQDTGREMLKLIHGPAKIAIVSYVKGAGSLQDRESGVRSVLEGRPGVELLDTFYAGGNPENAYRMMKRLLQETPDLYGIVGLNEPTAVGAGRAIRDLGLTGKVKLVGFDSSIPEIKLLEEGVMQVTVIQKPFQMGYLSVKTAVEAVRGTEVPAAIDTGSLIITKANMYEEENQKLLFPFVGK